MPKRTDIKKVMVIGSGPIVIAERGGVRGDPGEFQSGDDHDRHAYRRQGLYGAADARIRGQDHPLRASRCHRAGAGRPDGPESGRAAGQKGRVAGVPGRDYGYVVREHRAGRRPRAVQGAVRAAGRTGAAVAYRQQHGGGHRRRRADRLSGGAASGLHAGRYGRRLRRQPRGAGGADAQRADPLAGASGARRKEHQGV